MYVHFWTNTFGKGMKPLFLLERGYIVLLCSSQRMVLALNKTHRVDIKQNQSQRQTGRSTSPNVKPFLTGHIQVQKNETE